jgi:cyclopropane-fatty-acyl-phospholipid synthase
MHIFTHRSGAYLFDRGDREDWIAQHFFTGGVMPSHHLMRQYADLFAVEKEWRWSCTHYQRTAQDWLANFDAHRDAIEQRMGRQPLPGEAGVAGYSRGSSWNAAHNPVSH